MLNSLLFVLALSSAQAAPEVLKLTGLHCDACRDSIQSSACSGKEEYSKCEVKFTSDDKQNADLIIETKPGKKVDQKALIKQIEGMGYKATPATAKATVKK